MVKENVNVKEVLEQKAAPQEIKLKKNMDVKEMIQILQPEIKRALPSMISSERFTRMALSSLNTTPKLAECTQISFLSALMSAAQLGLEPNTPLGQAYLIPYMNKGKLECQFQIGYRGLIELVYRNGNIQSIQAQEVCEEDEFNYELGLTPRLFHRPALRDRGEPYLYYAVYRMTNGGFVFEVMSVEDIRDYARKYSKSIDSSYSPWNTHFDEMAKKTVIKKVLKYAPLQLEVQRSVSMDETIKTEISVDMSEVRNEPIQEYIEEEEN